MSILKEVRENFRFMVSEVTSQVEMTHDFTQDPCRGLVEKIFSGDDYIDTLKSLIEEKTFEMLMAVQPVNKRDVAMLRALNTITSNLERIADFAVNIPRQMEHLKNSAFLHDYGLARSFEQVIIGLGCIVPAVEKADTGLAFKICHSEFELDSFYAATFARILDELAAGGESGDLVTTLHIANYLERMGDSLLNIGEAILFAVVGEKMKIHQYRALSNTLASSGVEAPISQVEFESIWGTRSGCRIGTVQRQAMEESRRPVLFKHGNLKKLKEEKDNIARWEKLMPGLPPRIWDFQKTTESRGSVLMEYLAGCTLQDLVINGGETELDNALFLLEETLGRAWSVTKDMNPVSSNFVKQMKARCKAVFRMHPEFKTHDLAIGDLALPSFEALLEKLEAAAGDLKAPLRVLIHGDLNLNNIIYTQDQERVHFIDLHRSRMTDYVQDLSVFMISNYRLPVFEKGMRERAATAIGTMFEFGGKFARTYGDDCFEARLALGLARSLFTSTRFEMKRDFAHDMYLRSIYLIDKLINHQAQDSWQNFKLPRRALIY